MKKLFLAILCAFSTLANAGEWSSDDEKLYIASQIAIVADWSTTRYAARNNFSTGIYETNFILGHHPSVGKVDLYCIALLATNHLIADALPDEYRTYYFTFRLVSHGGASMHNMELGWKMQF